MYDKIKYWYAIGAWNINMVRNSVKKGKITETEFKEITGEDY